MAKADEILARIEASKAKAKEAAIKAVVEVAAPEAAAPLTRTTQAAVAKTISAPASITFTSRLPTVQIEIADGRTIKFVFGSYTTNKPYEIAELDKLVTRIPNNFARI